MILYCIVPLLFIFTLCASANGEETPSYTEKHVRGSIYMIHVEGNPMMDNVVASIGEDGILLVDDGFPETVETIRGTLRSIRNAPIKFVINTHFHHAGANDAFGKEATIIAHSSARKRMQTESKMYGMVPIGPWSEAGLPDIVFDSGMTLHFNGEEIELLHFPNVHTDGDIVAFFKNSNVVATGDFFVPLLGPCDLANGGDWQSLLSGIRKLLALVPEDAKIIPGHGTLSDYNDLQQFVQLTSEVTESVRDSMTNGRTLEEIKSLGIPERWAEWGKRGIPPDFFLTNIYEGLQSSK
ncbi:MBL fold metallo-hydrolase [bacterium]|nr:MBL fold metallo-hydrolase [bacterium]